MNQSLSRRNVLAGFAAAAAASAIPARAAEEKTAVAIIGCAHIHTPGFGNMLKKRDDISVKYVWDHDPARAKTYVDKFAAKFIDKPAEALDDPAVKAVIICSETNRHTDLVVPAANAKKAIFAEKPLSASGKEALAMADAIEKAGVVFSTGYFMRGDAKNLFLKEQVAAGAFGKITKVYAANCHSGSIGRWFDKEWRWMADPRIAGVGAFGDLGTHSLDILMWVLGDIESVAADVEVVLGNYGDCDESGQASLKFKNGALGTLVAGWVDIANPVSIMISGTEGIATVFHDKLYFKSNKVQGSNDGQPWTKLPAGKPHAFEMFLDKITNKGEPMLVTPREAALRVVAMEAMYNAAKEKKWVSVG
ncbi:MAG: Gfo/Idh/MocA family protein [Tepidisphaerales bacterium]